MSARARRHPQQFLPAARRLLANPPPLDNPALADQLDAAERDMKRTLSALIPAAEAFGYTTHPNLTTTPHTVAWCLALMAALDRIPAARYCTHLIDTGPRPVIASLTGRYVVCEPCHPERLLASLGAALEDPDHCDLCGAGSRTFTEITSVIGPLEVHANVCSSCQAFQARVPLSALAILP